MFLYITKYGLNMPSITNRVLTIERREGGKNYNVRVECDIQFTDIELCQMKVCGEETKLYKLKCSVLGDDPVFDDFLFSYSDVKYYPEGNPIPKEHAIFETSASGGLLNEDWGTDDLFARLTLQNLASHVSIEKDTDVIHANF
jgi:hypothetical protein